MFDFVGLVNARMYYIHHNIHLDWSFSCTTAMGPQVLTPYIIPALLVAQLATVFSVVVPIISMFNIIC